MTITMITHDDHHDPLFITIFTGWLFGFLPRWLEAAWGQRGHEPRLGKNKYCPFWAGRQAMPNFITWYLITTVWSVWLALCMTDSIGPSLALRRLCYRLDLFWRPRLLLLSHLRVAAQKLGRTDGGSTLVPV